MLRDARMIHCIVQEESWLALMVLKSKRPLEVSFASLVQAVKRSGYTTHAVSRTHDFNAVKNRTLYEMLSPK